MHPLVGTTKIVVTTKLWYGHSTTPATPINVALHRVVTPTGIVATSPLLRSPAAALARAEFSSFASLSAVERGELGARTRAVVFVTVSVVLVTAGLECDSRDVVVTGRG
jgi:hypothetical protein